MPITTAVEKLAETQGGLALKVFLQTLTQPVTPTMANFLLPSSIYSRAEYFANDAVDELFRQDLRVSTCGYSDSPYWVTIQIDKVRYSPLCPD